MKRSLKIFVVIIAMLMSITTMCINAFAISSPKLTKAAITLLVGESYQLYVNRAVESISWSTSNSKIANVSKGKVTAKSIGTATITAKHGTKSLKCTVTVTDRSSASGKSFEDAIFFNIGDTIENQYKMTESQEHVYYKFKTNSAGDYTITLSHPKDYFGSSHAIFLISDSGKNHVSNEEWFTGETSKTYTLKGNSVYYLETWDYVIFSIVKEKNKTPSITYDGKSYETAIPYKIGSVIDNQSIMISNQEHVYYKFTTSSAGNYTITLSHPKDYFGTAHAIFLISDSEKNHVSDEEWFIGETSKTYTLNADSVYYLETWDYVIFSIVK